MIFHKTFPLRHLGAVAFAACVLLFGVSATGFSNIPDPARTGIPEILAAFDLSVPAQRERAVALIRDWENEEKAIGLEVAREMGLPIRVELPDGTVKEIAMIDAEGRPVYFVTHNDNAAISTGAAVLNTGPYHLDGFGIAIGMWDAGAGRASHQEFAGGRMVVMDGASVNHHATHVGGTLAAAGVVARAKGMAYASVVESYDWNNDKSEMTSRGATAPGEAGSLYLSNHSYGFVAGWLRAGGSNPAYIWYGSGSTETSMDPRFGQYNSTARDSDVLAHNAPYYLMFRSAGNERTDNPVNGQTVQLSPGSTTTTTYDSSIHPPGDGFYRGGFDTISFDAVAKNVMTVGSVSDAVTNGQRDPSNASVSSFSSWGPTDDGRIKPDIVANGEWLYSTLSSSNTAYGTLSGTSMSAPNAAGTAALLIQKYSQLFPGDAMRASTLKGLLIHTADDLGIPGPNYKYGWGLINAEAAADLIRDHAANPLKIRMTESLLTSGEPTASYEFVWDGEEPIRVTLSWTDPAGSATTNSDNRSSRLRNNLDVRVVGPDGSIHHPYVMPFVGTWTRESMEEPATTGINNTDNVEQVFIQSPSVPGAYRAEIRFQGTLANNQQHYALLISGSSAEEPPPPPLSVSAVSPGSGSAGSMVTLDISGIALSTATGVVLARDGAADIPATNLRMADGVLRCEIDLTGAAGGEWDVVVTSAEETAILAKAFTVIIAIYSENFNGTVTGWTSVATTGSNSWILTDTQAHTVPTSYFAPAPSTKTTTRLVSPSISIPSSASDLQLRFWHRFDLQPAQDGGRLYLSNDDGGSWFAVDDANSGVSFASNGYNTSISFTRSPPNRSEFERLEAWSGNSNGFIETVLNFNDTGKFAGKTVRFAWVIATNASVASPGWHVDSIMLTGGGDLVNTPPLIVAAASTSATDSIITEDEIVIDLIIGAEVNVFVSATDDGGAENLTYTWAASGSAPVFFLPNASNTADQSAAVFEALGNYELTVTVTDSGGLSSTSTAHVRVVPTASGIEVQPRSAIVPLSEGLQFEATLLDQFEGPIAEQPSSFAWSASGGGAIDSNGFYFSDAAGENFAIMASVPSMADAQDEIIGFALVTVTPTPATVTLTDLMQPYDGEAKRVTVVTEPEGLFVVITYDGNEEAPADVGGYEVVATVDDPNHQGSATATLVIGVAATAVDDVFSRPEGESLEISVAEILVNDFSDFGPLVLTGVASISDAGFSIILQGDTVLYVAEGENIASDFFTYTIEDGLGFTDTGTVVVKTMVSGGSVDLTLLSVEVVEDTGHIRVSFTGIPGHEYEIQVSSPLGGDWETVKTIEANHEGVFEYIDEEAHQYSARFYRALSR